MPMNPLSLSQLNELPETYQKTLLGEKFLIFDSESEGEPLQDDAPDELIEFMEYFPCTTSLVGREEAAGPRLPRGFHQNSGITMKMRLLTLIKRTTAGKADTTGNSACSWVSSTQTCTPSLERYKRSRRTRRPASLSCLLGEK